MQREIEIKILNIDVDRIQDKLISLGATKIGRELQKNYTFTPKGREFDNGYLRIRETFVEDIRKSIELTFKEVKTNEGVRINNEYTTNIDSVSMMIKILEQLGIFIKYEGKKERISYLYQDQRFDIDIWDKNTYPYPYMEIEFTSQDRMEDILKDLDIDMADVTTESISELRDKLEK